MALPTNIQQGVDIRKKVGGSFMELRYLRQSIWALMVLTDQENFSQADIDKANTIKTTMLALNDEIEAMLE